MTDDFEPVPDTQAPPDDESIPDDAQAGEGVEEAPHTEDNAAVNHEPTTNPGG